jgi:nitrogen PTS system EIIA component
MELDQLISLERVTVLLPVNSKKRLLEKLSILLRVGSQDLDEQTALQSLIERERLGSTGIGEGVALPHGRIKGIKQAIGAFVTLAEDMDFDALDHKPVRLVFALLIPEEADKEHLQILSQLAVIFKDPETRAKLLQAKSPEEVYDRLTHIDSS